MTLKSGKECLFYTHGMTNTPTYRSWAHMKSRCSGSGGKHKWYLNKGISYSTEWEKFENFLFDLGIRPEGCTLDRIDNDKGYSKENCRWVTMAIQNRNRSSNRYFEYKGRRQCIGDWAVECNISKAKLYRRLSAGWEFEKAIETPGRL